MPFVHALSDLRRLIARAKSREVGALRRQLQRTTLPTLQALRCNKPWSRKILLQCNDAAAPQKTRTPAQLAQSVDRANCHLEGCVAVITKA